MSTLQLPALPGFAFQALALFFSDEPNTRMLARSLGNDPGLASRTLELANSSLYGAQNPTSDLVQAIGRIGLDAIRQLVTTYAVKESFKFSADCGFDWHMIWEHLSLTGQIAYRLAKLVEPRHVSDIHIAALLHDVGLFVLAHNSPELAHTLVEQCRGAQQTFAEAEKVLEIEPHASLGAELIKSWNLPCNVAAAVELHEEHLGEKSTVPPEVKRILDIVNLADIFALKYGTQPEGWSRNLDIDPKQLTALGLAESTLLDVVNSSKQWLLLEAAHS